MTKYPETIPAFQLMKGDVFYVKPTTDTNSKRYRTIESVRRSGSLIEIQTTDGESAALQTTDLVTLFERNWKNEPGKLVKEPKIDYEVLVQHSDGHCTALYFKELDFIKDLDMSNLQSITITPRRTPRV